MDTLKLKPATARKLKSFKSLDVLTRTTEGRLRVRFGLDDAEIKELIKALEKQGRVLCKQTYHVRNRRGRPPVEKKQMQLWVYLPEEIVAQIGEKPAVFIKELVLKHFAK